jgi:hypothetical protein
MSGSSPGQTDWNAFMAGKGVILIGEGMPFAMTVSEKMRMDVRSQDERRSERSSQSENSEECCLQSNPPGGGNFGWGLR